MRCYLPNPKSVERRAKFIPPQIFSRALQPNSVEAFCEATEADGAFKYERNKWEGDKKTTSTKPNKNKVAPSSLSDLILPIINRRAHFAWFQLPAGHQRAEMQECDNIKHQYKYISDLQVFNEDSNSHDSMLLTSFFPHLPTHRVHFL